MYVIYVFGEYKKVRPVPGSQVSDRCVQSIPGFFLPVRLPKSHFLKSHVTFQNPNATLWWTRSITFGFFKNLFVLLLFFTNSNEQMDECHCLVLC